MGAVLSSSFCRLADLLAGRRTVALTGAGCSTESGIPDYRGEDLDRRTPTPIRYREFVGHRRARVRYWARSSVGWLRVARARPNPAHRALAGLERDGRLAGVVTQNVDGLHRSAGSRRVVDLHGRLDRVVCLDCGAPEERAAVQRRILELNPGWEQKAIRPRFGGGHGVEEPSDLAGAGDGPSPGTGSDARPADAAPDGDADLAGADLAGFRVPRCLACGGVLKPDVVFFGENVPKERVEEAWRLYEEADALLVAGSSLTVYSGFRFVLRAHRDGVPVALVNLGETRGDELATVRVEGRVGQVLPALADELSRPGGPGRRRAG